MEVGISFPNLFFMKTKRGIFLNILDSTYTFKVGEITFYFSSPFYRQLFIDKHEEEIHRFNHAAKAVYKNKFNLAFDMLALIRLYTLIEKRGFYIKVRKETILCPDDIKYDIRIHYKTNSDSLKDRFPEKSHI